eukprot:189381_1
MLMALILTAFQFIHANSQLYMCNHVQYSTGEVEVIDQCLASSVNGIVSSHIISCYSGVRGTIFTETIYRGPTCNADELVSNEIIASSTIQSYKCDGGDCTQIYRLYETDQTQPGVCINGQNFEDIGVIRGYGYQTTIGKDVICTEYDCANADESVTITDCFGMRQQINLDQSSQCDAEDTMFLDGLLHCGASTARVGIIPWIPAPQTTTATTTTSQQAISTTSITLITESSTSSSTSSSTVYESADGTSMNEEVNASDDVYALNLLPALPIQAVVFLITLFVFILTAYYLLCNSQEQTMQLSLKVSILSTFIFNTCSVGCLFVVCLMMHVSVWNLATQAVVEGWYYGACIGYVCGKFCLELVFLLRVYTAFKNNIFRISKTTLWSLFVWMTICAVLWVFLMISDNRYWASSYHLYIVATVSDVSLIVVLMYLFTTRLQTVIIRETIAMRDTPRKQRNAMQPVKPVMGRVASGSATVSTQSHSDHLSVRNDRAHSAVNSHSISAKSESNYSADVSMSMADSMQFRICCVLDANDITAIKEDLQSQNASLISLMTKLVLLSSISLITTAVFGVYLFAEVSMNDEALFIVFALWAIDICINSICLFLNFGFSNAIYQKLCTRPHAMTQWVIETIFITKIVIKEARKEGI